MKTFILLSLFFCFSAHANTFPLRAYCEVLKGSKFGSGCITAEVSRKDWRAPIIEVNLKELSDGTEAGSWKTTANTESNGEVSCSVRVNSSPVDGKLLWNIYVSVKSTEESNSFMVEIPEKDQLIPRTTTRAGYANSCDRVQVMLESVR